jgi:hypothetical protein
MCVWVCVCARMCVCNKEKECTAFDGWYSYTTMIRNNKEKGRKVTNATPIDVLICPRPPVVQS